MFKWATFREILLPSSGKVNNIWVDKGSEFYNRSMKSFLQNNDIEYIQHITKGNLSWLKDLLELQKMKIIDTSIGKLDDIVKKYDNTYHSTIKMKPVDIKSKTYIDSSKEIDNKDPKFKIGDIVGI